MRAIHVLLPPKGATVWGESGHEVAERGTTRSRQAVLLFPPPSDNPPKLSPGWNKVALLTVVRNSPCSCPFSVSLHPPQAALNSKPRKRWRLLVRFTNSYVKPALKGEVANVVSRRGYKAAYSSLFVTTPQSRLAPCQLPGRGAFNSLSQTFGLPAPSKREPFGALYKLLH